MAFENTTNVLTPERAMRLTHEGLLAEFYRTADHRTSVLTHELAMRLQQELDASDREFMRSTCQ